jgi:asparagine synthase (glutamine-hydrolysing)
MCGIAGHVVARDGNADLQLVQRMCAQLVHRGPDSSGFHDNANVALGIRRLAIIDVPGGDQPISNEDNSITVVLNGEIYNYRELRSDLESRGHTFATRSDTEVLVHLYEEVGSRLVESLRGMFAFALWDARRDRLLLGRDRVGKKPLYYAYRNGALTFASELAALLEDASVERDIDPKAIDAFLALGYIPSPYSAIRGVRKLPPASTLTWEAGNVSLDRYWSLSFTPKADWSPEVVRERILDALRDAVRVRLLSERPLGAFLSGGVDSTAVVAMMAELSSEPVKTFAIGFESSRHNELPHARRVAELFATDHHETVVQPDALSVLPRLITLFGDPFADSSAIPSYYVAHAASQVVTVALNGDGGDESFAGYNRYISNGIAERLEVLPRPARVGIARAARLFPEPGIPNSTAGRIRRLALSLPLGTNERYQMRMSILQARDRVRTYSPEFLESVYDDYVTPMFETVARNSSATSPVDRMLDIDLNTYLPGDLLTKMDIASMANSLEARSPFLDHRLMELAARLPASWKVRGTTTKFGLKSALRSIVPDDLLDRPKWGFSIPLAEWVRGPLHATIRDVLLDPAARSRNIFLPGAVKELLDQHANQRVDRSSEIWALFVLELWQRRFIDRASEAALF